MGPLRLLLFFQRGTHTHAGSMAVSRAHRPGVIRNPGSCHHEGNLPLRGRPYSGGASARRLHEASISGTWPRGVSSAAFVGPHGLSSAAALRRGLSSAAWAAVEAEDRLARQKLLRGDAVARNRGAVVLMFHKPQVGHPAMDLLLGISRPGNSRPGIRPPPPGPGSSGPGSPGPPGWEIDFRGGV